MPSPGRRFRYTGNRNLVTVDKPGTPPFLALGGKQTYRICCAYSLTIALSC